MYLLSFCLFYKTTNLFYFLTFQLFTSSRGTAPMSSVCGLSGWWLQTLAGSTFAPVCVFLPQVTLLLFLCHEVPFCCLLIFTHEHISCWEKSVSSLAQIPSALRKAVFSLAPESPLMASTWPGATTSVLIPRKPCPNAHGLKGGGRAILYCVDWHFK